MADGRRSVRQRLESLERAGVTGLRKTRKSERGTRQEGPSAGSPKSSADTAATKSSASQAPSVPQDPVAALAMVREQVRTCMRCPELCTTRTQTVFGVGNPRPRLVFLGEAPGADEDKQGEPFVGRAGQLLTKIIEACRLRREDVYILNVLKCRPPGNRNPLPDEAANCREYLDAQLAILKPEFVCCLGAVAAKAFFEDDKLSISRVRGQLLDHRGLRVMCTFHPAYLLRNPAAKRDVWEDMKKLMRAMGVELDQS